MRLCTSISVFVALTAVWVRPADAIPADVAFWPARIDVSSPDGVDMTVGDVNGDLVPDAIVGATSAGGMAWHLSVHLGLGDGRFAQAVKSPTAPMKSIVSGYFDADGHLDVAVANYLGSVHVHLGSGDGTFQAGVQYGVGPGPLWLTTGDLNDDDVPDLVSAHDHASVWVLLGNGDGTFAPAIAAPAGGSTSAVAIRDVTVDGIPDIVASRFFGNGFVVLVGAGDGTFTIGTSYPAGTGCWAIAVGDLNADTHGDVVIANRDSDDLSVRFGDGLGEFGPEARLTVPDRPIDVIIGDATDDGVVDIVVGHESGYVSVVSGCELGGFSDPLVLAAPGTARSVRLVDSDDDGRRDLVFLGADFVASVLGTVNGGFEEAPRYVAGPIARGAEIGFLNADPFPDLVVALEGSDSVAVLSGESGGGFSMPDTYGVGNAPWGVVTSDFNGDTAADVAVANRMDASLTTLLGDGAGGFAGTSTTPVANGPIYLASDDFNGDGVPDLATACTWDSTLAILLGDGDGTFAATTIDMDVTLRPIVSGYFDADTCVDLALGTSDGVIVLFGEGDGTFPDQVTIPSVDEPLYAIALLSDDLDGDSLDDLAAMVFLSGDVTVSLSNGDRTFDTTGSYVVQEGAELRWATAADVVGDTSVDLIVTSTRNVAVLPGDGQGGFGSPTFYGLGAVPVWVGTWDIDGDGRLDIVSTNQSSGDVAILYGVDPSVGVDPGPPSAPPVVDFVRMHPNPTHGVAIASFEFLRPTEVQLTVFDVAGRVVKRLGNAVFPVGSHRVTWDGTRQDGRRVGSGRYFVRVETPDRTQTIPLSLVR